MTLLTSTGRRCEVSWNTFRSSADMAETYLDKTQINTGELIEHPNCHWTTRLCLIKPLTIRL